MYLVFGGLDVNKGSWNIIELVENNENYGKTVYISNLSLLLSL